MINNIKYFRELNNITQRRLAEKIDITISQLSNIENNRSNCSIEIALKIAQVLCCTVEDLFKL